jgi:alpha(1,3/1,4) fucosyltransferase
MMMKLIGLHNAEGYELSCFGSASRDNCNEPFRVLERQCEARGYKLVPLRGADSRECEHVVFWDWPGADYNLVTNVKSRRPKGFVTLWTWEPPSIIEEHWNPEFHALFDRILTWKDSLVDGRRYFKFYMPSVGTMPTPRRVPFEQKKMLVNISMNKFSAYRYELYGARRQSIRYFEKHAPDSFDLYGVGWNPLVSWKRKLRALLCGKLEEIRHYPSYKGRVANKWDVFPDYKYALCYENVSDQDGWVTEKMFDCMRADCVPIYWGAPNVTTYADPNAFIDRRRFDSDAMLFDYLKHISQEQYAKYREAIDRYLSGPGFQSFLPASFARNFMRALGIT